MSVGFETNQEINFTFMVDSTTFNHPNQITVILYQFVEIVQIKNLLRLIEDHNQRLEIFAR